MPFTRYLTSRIGRALLAALALGFTATSAALAAGGTHYYVNDHLATTVGIADASGEIAALEADAFGSPLQGGANASRFTGKPYDEDLGAFVFPFRNYRADEARWMSADPSGFPDGVNGIAYAPLPFQQFDPLGLATATMYRDFVRTVEYSVNVVYWSKISQTFTATPSSASLQVAFSANSIAYSNDPDHTGVTNAASIEPESGTPSYTYTSAVPSSPWTYESETLDYSTHKVTSLKRLHIIDGIEVSSNSASGYKFKVVVEIKGKQKYVE